MTGMTVNLSVVREGGASPLTYEVKRMINAGFTGRDRASVQAHIDELAVEGVDPPPAVPVLYPVVSHNITTGERIDVVSARTSGEVEAVLFLSGSEMFVGVGSDHTDRALEAYGILESKQVCLNVCSADVWPFGDVKERWDDLVIRSWVRASPSEGEALYQEGTLAELLPPDELVERVILGINGGSRDGLVIFGGTVPIQSGRTICGSEFRCELEDRSSGRRLGCRYEVNVLEDPNGMHG